jgi:hypothetical protein
MEVSVLVPWRSQDPQRIKVWDYIKWEWSLMNVEICAASDGRDHGPFNTAKACNNAFKMSTKNWLVTTGADVIPDFTMIETGLHVAKRDNLRWVPLGNQTEYFNAEATDRILQTKKWWTEATDPLYTVPFQTGIMLIRRDLYLETGGHDERFEGWGGEDAAFRRAVHMLGGESDPVPLSLRCLWHDPGRRGTMSKKNFELCYQYDNTHTREGMLKLIEERGRYV